MRSLGESEAGGTSTVATRRIDRRAIKIVGIGKSVQIILYLSICCRNSRPNSGELPPLMRSHTILGLQASRGGVWTNTL